MPENLLNANLMKDFKYNSFFSEYLPPKFKLKSEECDIFNIPYVDKGDLISPLEFNMSRFTEDEQRRTIYLPEVVSYIQLIKYMESESIIEELCNLSRGDKHSFSQILQGEKFIRHEMNYTRIEINDDVVDDNPSLYINNIIKKVTQARGAQGIYYIDISNCFKSIYTHFLPTIPLGYQAAEREYRRHRSDQAQYPLSDTYKKYQKLDIIIRKLNMNQTNGLLVGPPVCNYIVEGLLSRIDTEIENEGINFSRYVDDYEVYIYDKNEREDSVHKIEKILSKYDLSINQQKTQYTEFPYYVMKNLKKIFDDYGDNLSAEDLLEMFNEYFILEKNGVKGATRYLIKTIPAGYTVKDRKLFTTLMFNILVNDKRSIIKVCELMCKMRLNEKLPPLGYDGFKQLYDILEQSIEKRYDLEVIWLIYLLKNTGRNKLNKSLYEKIMHSRNELAMVVLIEEFEQQISRDLINDCSNNATSWILLYQLYLHNYISKDDFANKSGIKKNINFYKKLKENNFSFYK